MAGLSGVTAAVEFRIAGNSELPDESILEWIAGSGCTVVDSACIDSVCHRVASHYWLSGYLDVDVECERAAAGDDAIEITISEGRLSVLESVRVTGAPAAQASALERMFDDQTGKPFSQRHSRRAYRQCLSSTTFAAIP
jgi:outer membrane protein assembly factor BamA